MKYCPNCDERYDEEIIKFCTKDGTPLIDDEQPSFTALPSENLEDDIGEETIIRRKPMDSGASERIVIPTSSEPEPQVRPRTTAAYYPPPPQSNTAKTVVLTVLGTVFLLGCGAILFWLFRGDRPANTNINTNLNANQNVNLNANVGFDANFNFNSNANFNSSINTNLNANLKTPTPSPTPKPSPSGSPSPSPTATPAASPTPTRPPANRPAPTPTPRTGPRPPGNGNNM